jgi:hypothetical protein
MDRAAVYKTASRMTVQEIILPQALRQFRGAGPPFAARRPNPASVDFGMWWVVVMRVTRRVSSAREY